MSDDDAAAATAAAAAAAPTTTTTTTTSGDDDADKGKDKQDAAAAGGGGGGGGGGGMPDAATLTKMVEDGCQAADIPRYAGTDKMCISQLDLAGDGVMVPVSRFISDVRRKELMSDAFERRAGDVWIATYLKSGTTWTMEIVKQLHGGAATDSVLKKVPWPEVDGRVPVLGVSIEQLNGIPSPRAFKSHWWPRDHMVADGKSRYIYVMRNGLDVLVSMWHHARGFGLYQYDGHFADFFEHYITGRVDFGAWWEHVRQWWARRNDDDVLFLRYEDMKADPRAAVLKIAKHIGVTPEPAQVDDIVRLSSFDAMKERGVDYDALRKKGATPFMRRGLVGDSKHYVTQSMRRRFIEKCKEAFVGDAADVPWQEHVVLDDDDDDDKKKAKSS